MGSFAPVDLYAKREKIFTRAVTGRFQRIRLYSGWPFLLAYLGVPWLDVGWPPGGVIRSARAPLLRILHHVLAPGFHAVTGVLVIAAFALFTFTSVVGRVWCGYTCPQTIWTAIFMWAEQFAEGPRHVRIKLDQARWSFEKLRKRLFKHGLWLGWALLTGLTFVGYFTPIRELVSEAATLTLGGWALFWTLFFTAATYFNAGWLREQVCIHMCPYARFQSAMFDADTLIVAYDVARGEPRGPRKRDAQPDSASATASIASCAYRMSDRHRYPAGAAVRMHRLCPLHRCV